MDYIECPITLSRIPEGRLITFEENGHQFHFDINALACCVHNGCKISPLTRNPLTEEVIEKLEKWSMIEINYQLYTGFKNSTSMCRISRYLSIGDLVCNILKLNLREYDTNINFFALPPRQRYTIGNQNGNLYDLNFENSITSTFEDILDNQNIKIDVYSSRLSHSSGINNIKDLLLPKLWNFFVANSEKYHQFITEIPLKYTIPLSVVSYDSKEDFLVIRYLLENIDLKRKSRKDFHNFLRQTSGRTISCAEYNTLVYEIFYRENDIYLLAYEYQSLLASIIWDKWNIGSRGVEGYYNMSKYDKFDHMGILRNKLYFKEADGWTD